MERKEKWDIGMSLIEERGVCRVNMDVVKLESPTKIDGLERKG